MPEQSSFYEQASAIFSKAEQKNHVSPVPLKAKHRKVIKTFKFEQTDAVPIQTSVRLSIPPENFSLVRRTHVNNSNKPPVFIVNTENQRWVVIETERVLGGLAVGGQLEEITPSEQDTLRERLTEMEEAFS